MSERFVQFAAECSDEVLDLGCAYGVAVRRVLSVGGKACACDMDLRHLEVLSRSISPELNENLRCVAGAVPDIDFEENAFGAILCSRLLHFLDGPDVEVTVSKMYRWLRPGGKAFLIVDTPYSGAMSKQILPEYEKKKASKDPWPGFIADFSRFIPAESSLKFDTSFIHLMDPDTLARVCEQAGFAIESKGFMARVANLNHADPKGRDHAAVVAVKA